MKIVPVLLVTLTYLIMSHSLMAQLTFQRSYVSTGSVQGHSVKQTADGGYVMAGMTFYDALELDDLLLVRTDSIGDTLWTKTYGGTMGEFGNSVTIIQTDDNSDGITDDGFFMTGVTKSFGELNGDFYMLKLDENGNIEWESTASGSGIDLAQSAWQTNDGGFIVAGSSNSLPGNSTDFHILKLAHNGNLDWDYTIGGNFAEHATTVQETPDGSFIIAGSTRSFNVDAFFGGYLVKLNSNGTLDWDKVYDHSEIDQFVALDQTNDGGIILTGFVQQTGTTDHDISIVKLDNLGEIIWSKRYGGTEDERGIYIQETANGDLIVSAYTESFGSGNRDLLLFRTDHEGNVLWANTYGSTKRESTGLWGESVDQTADGGFVLLGDSKSFTPVFDPIQALYLVKTDANGNSHCHEKNISLTTDTLILNTIIPNSTTAGSLTYGFQTSTPLPSLVLSSIDVLCTSLSIASANIPDLKIAAYPNPTKEHLTLNLRNLMLNGIQPRVLIFDMSGRIIIETEVKHSIIQIDLKDYKPGIYTYQVLDQTNTVLTGKVIKL